MSHVDHSLLAIATNMVFATKNVTESSSGLNMIQTRISLTFTIEGTVDPFFCVCVNN